MYAQGGSPKAIIDILDNRFEASQKRSPNYSIQQQFDALQNIFSKQYLKNGTAANENTPHLLTLSANKGKVSNEHSVEIFAGSFLLKNTESKKVGTIAVLPVYEPGNDPGVVITHDQIAAFGYTLRSSAFELVLNGHSSQQPPPPIEKAFLARVQGLDVAQIDDIWDELLLRDTSNDIVECLRIISPKIERINLVRAPGQTHRQPFAKIMDIDEPVTLKSLGEGLNRLFGVAVILVQSKGGIALIDEIDTGLHYSVIQKFWDFVFKSARKLNVQVFATTHSWDCIEGFGEALQSDETFDGQLISLRKSRKPEDETVHVVSYERREIAIATKEHIEVR